MLAGGRACVNRCHGRASGRRQLVAVTDGSMDAPRRGGWLDETVIRALP